MNEKTELIFVIDQSGSMNSLAEDVVGGYNALLEEQRKKGEVEVTTIFFSDKSTFVHESEDIKNVKPLQSKDYNPCGCTALLDAIGNGISYIKARHAKLKPEEIPGVTIFSIMTDGLENASREFGYSDVKGMIEMGKKLGFEFIFQAANIDTEREGRRLGIDPRRTFSFNATKDGVRAQMNFCAMEVSRLADAKRKK